MSQEPNNRINWLVFYQELEFRIRNVQRHADCDGSCQLEYS